MDLGSPALNASAFFIAFTIVVIFLLWLGGIYSKKLPREASGGKTVTLFGYLFTLVFITILIFILSLGHIAPDIPSYYRTIALFVVFAIAAFAEKIATKFGLNIIKNTNDKNV